MLDMDQTKIQQMQSALEQYRSSKGGPSSAQSASDDTNSKIQKALSTYRAQGSNRGAGYTPIKISTAVPENASGDNGNIISSVAKGILSPVATLAARPVQALAEVGQLATQGKVDPDAIDTATKKIPILGGLVAPVERTYRDVGKDVGRAAETIALGTGAPILGGALYGAGASLEQGNNLLSPETAGEAALGAIGGKVLGAGGNLLFKGVSKVGNVITPEALKPALAAGARGVADTASKLSPFNGETTDLTKTITAPFQKGGKALSDMAAEQFPALSPVEYYKAVNKKDFLAPIETNSASFSKATEIAKDAQRRGIDIGDELNKLGIQHDRLVTEGKYSTKDVAKQLVSSALRENNPVYRAAIQESGYGVPNVPVSKVRDELLAKVDGLSGIGSTERQSLRNVINRKYGDTSVEATQHPDGYKLINLHDNRIAAGQNGKYIPGVSTTPTIRKAKVARLEENVFKKLFDNSLPEGPVQEARREFEKKFVVADYLESLDKKKVPLGIVKRSVRLFGRGLGGIVGSKVGGFPGFLAGSRFGDILFNSFETIPSPLKGAVLNRMSVEEPEAFAALRQHLGEKETERLLRRSLPASGQSSFKEPGQTLFATPGGVITPNKGEAVDVTSVEQGRAKTPTTNRKLKSYLTKAKDAQDTSRVPYIPPRDLPVINAGKKPKTPRKLNDIYIK